MHGDSAGDRQFLWIVSSRSNDESKFPPYCNKFAFAQTTTKYLERLANIPTDQCDLRGSFWKLAKQDDNASIRSQMYVDHTVIADYNCKKNIRAGSEFPKKSCRGKPPRQGQKDIKEQFKTVHSTAASAGAGKKSHFLNESSKRRLAGFGHPQEGYVVDAALTNCRRCPGFESKYSGIELFMHLLHGGAADLHHPRLHAHQGVRDQIRDGALVYHRAGHALRHLHSLGLGEISGTSIKWEQNEYRVPLVMASMLRP